MIDPSIVPVYSSQYSAYRDVRPGESVKRVDLVSGGHGWVIYAPISMSDALDRLYYASFAVKD